jgi:hypothetical protein
VSPEAQRAPDDDTDPKVRAAQVAILRAMSPARKWELVEDADRTSRQLALAGLRLRHPQAGPEELNRRLMDLILGPELAAKAYGPLPTER